MRILAAWKKEVKCDLLYAALQLAWWLAEGSSVLGSAFRGNARRAGGRAVRPRRIKATPNTSAA
ncbi:hypothetical protein [Hymenobacter bucti]|uniref:Uncharacterized protein n=1 Tax=Hymenobacter bucti TaxID=1844114 RepID=A0ABW4QRH1_9BACT